MAGGLPRSLHSVDKLADSNHSPHTPQDFAAAYDNVKELERILRMNMCFHHCVKLPPPDVCVVVTG